MKDKTLLVSKLELNFLQENNMLDEIEGRFIVNSYGFKGIEAIENKKIKSHPNNISIDMKNSISYPLPPPFPLR